MSITDAITALHQKFGERCTVSEAVRDHHSRGESYHTPMRPDAVMFPRSTEEVSQIVKICAAHDCPIIPFGIGSSLEGHVVPLQGGVSLDMTEMNAILEINAQDLDAVVQPGLSRRRLNEELRDTGLFFSVDPGADATMGGMAATRASGTNAVRYGTMRENVLALEAVMADGRIIRAGSRARKSSAGYDLCKLIVGSEGTLGIITELTVRLFGQPEATSAAVCRFDDVEKLVDAVILTIQSGIPVARIEFLDPDQISAVNAYSKLSLAEEPTLFLEFHGSEAGVKEQAEQFGEIAAEYGAVGFEWASAAEDRNRLWRARHDAYYAMRRAHPGKEGIATDACVPISKLSEAMMETKADVERSGLIAPMLGHVGDGNFHLAIMVDPADADEMKRAKELTHNIAERAIRLGGTVTGEHGVGMGKIRYLEEEFGDGYAVMREIKRALDPKNILNPGKVVSMN